MNEREAISIAFNSYYSLLAISTKYGFPGRVVLCWFSQNFCQKRDWICFYPRQTLQSFVESDIVEVSINKIANWIRVCVVDWTVEWVIIASNVNVPIKENWKMYLIFFKYKILSV